MSIVLALVVGNATAGEIMDCYNDEIDADARYTSAAPEVLRVTDADVAQMLIRIREDEKRSVASTGAEPALRVTLRSETSASD